MKRIVVDIEENKNIDVKLIGEHFSKRTLLQVLKAIRMEYRRKVIMHQRNITMEANKSRAEAKAEAEEKVEIDSLGENSNGITRAKTESGLPAVVQPRTNAS